MEDTLWVDSGLKANECAKSIVLIFLRVAPSRFNKVKAQIDYRKSGFYLPPSAKNLN